MVTSSLSFGNIQFLGTKQLCKPYTPQICSECINFSFYVFMNGQILTFISGSSMKFWPLESGRMYASKIRIARVMPFFKHVTSSSVSVTSVLPVTNDMANSDHLSWVVCTASLNWTMKPAFPMLQNQKYKATTLWKYHKTKEWSRIQILGLIKAPAGHVSLFYFSADVSKCYLGDQTGKEALWIWAFTYIAFQKKI